jgi:hypothetical protein
MVAPPPNNAMCCSPPTNEVPASVSRFSVKVEVVKRGPGITDAARITIFEEAGGVARQLGGYDRNHAGWCDSTFAPFVQDGRWYALYAPDYTATRIMELPSCKDLGGEDPHTNGFCPVDYYVPHDHPDVERAGDAGLFGFVAGCIWGDDSSWKIQYLDLSNAASGILVRKEIFGYVAMPYKAARLADCISLDEYSREYPRAEITVSLIYDLAKGVRADL